MNTLFYREFAVLAEEKNYMEAAERLYMNQSTLSKHIKTMESELGVPLFDRSTRRVELTEYGKALLPHALNITRTEFEYSSLLMQIKNREKGIMTLGTIPPMAQYGIIGLLAAFQNEYPDSHVTILEEDSQNLLYLLREKKCELIFLRESKLDFEKNFLDDQEIIRIPFVQDHLIAVLPCGHPLAGNIQITLRELKDETFCLIKEGTLLYEMSVNACQASGFIPNISFTSHRIESLLDMVSTGDYVALLTNLHAAPPKFAHADEERPWVPVDLTPNINSQISLCYPANSRLSTSAQNFVNFCQYRCIEKQRMPGFAGHPYV